MEAGPDVSNAEANSGGEWGIMVEVAPAWRNGLDGIPVENWGNCGFFSNVDIGGVPKAGCVNDCVPKGIEVVD